MDNIKFNRFFEKNDRRGHLRIREVIDSKRNGFEHYMNKDFEYAIHLILLRTINKCVIK